MKAFPVLQNHKMRGLKILATGTNALPKIWNSNSYETKQKTERFTLIICKAFVHPYIVDRVNWHFIHPKLQPLHLP